MASCKLKIYALFGDFGSHASKKVVGKKHTLYFSKYKFEDYFSLDSFNKRKLIVDRDIVRKIIKEMEDFQVIYVGDSCEAILIWYVLRKLKCADKIFLINDVDLLNRAKEVHGLIYKHYNERIFDEFLTSPYNHWMYISASRREMYLKMGIPEYNLFYIPAASSTINFFFPELRKEMRKCFSEYSIDEFNGKIVSVGSHNRDYETLAAAVKNTGLEIHIICNLRAYKPINVPNLFWHDSLPEYEYVRAIKNARLIVIPLKENERASGQMNCSISMYLGKIVVSSKTDALQDFIRDKITGFFYKSGSTEDLESVLRFVENNFNEVQIVGEKAKEAEKELSLLARRNMGKFLTKAGGDISAEA